VVAGLNLADGNTWGIVAGDERAATIVSCLEDAMQLQHNDTPTYRLFVFTNGDGAYSISPHTRLGHPMVIPGDLLTSDSENTFTCFVPPARNKDIMANQLLRLSLYFVRETQRCGGFLLHGALAERDGWAVILAGPGGAGKTTASRRLTSPWYSLSDDATLVVRGEDGAYWAHPWPTWSYFMSSGPGGTWDVSHAVPLKAIFFLQQEQQDRVEPVTPGQAVCLLVELTEHTSWSMAHGQGRDAARKLRLQRFNNICSLAKLITCYSLHMSLDGAFWEAIEQIMTVTNNTT
jgi:SynChlorMet cassette protein ScmC